MIIERISPKQLRQFAEDLNAGLIFTSAQILEPDPDEWAQITLRAFIPLLLGCFAEVKNPADLGVVWAYQKEAFRRSVSGYPCFSKCRMMHLDDWRQVIDWMKEIQSSMKDILEQ